MAEKLEIYDLDSNFLGIQDRDEFYDEIKKEFEEKGEISRKVKTIRLLLLNSSGGIYLQKRSKFKNDNAGMYDKTVGGHVTAGDSYELTVIRKCAEELGFPAAVLPEDEFEKAIKSTRLDIVGIFKKIDYVENFDSERVLDEGDVFIQPFIAAFYVGYYNGAIRFVDGESSGVEVYRLEELEKEIKNNPDKFTKDIKMMVEKYREFLKPLI